MKNTQLQISWTYKQNVTDFIFNKDIGLYKWNGMTTYSEAYLNQHNLKTDYLFVLNIKWSVNNSLEI